MNARTLGLACQPQSDERRLLECRRGRDEAAFVALVERHGPPAPAGRRVREDVAGRPDDRVTSRLAFGWAYVAPYRLRTRPQPVRSGGRPPSSGNRLARRSKAL
jgi:hypothetical protein